VTTAPDASGALRRWVRGMAVCDVVMGPLLLVLPMSVFAAIPELVRPVPADNPLAVRLLGLYAFGLAPGWLAGWNDPVRNGGAVWTANALRAIGTIGLLLGATFDPHMPLLLRVIPLGEGVFAARTAWLMKKAGMTWLTPP